MKLSSASQNGQAQMPCRTDVEASPLIILVFTHDLDFGSALALTHASEPSAIQLRGQRVLPEHVGPLVLAALRQYETELGAGALIVIEESKSRVRILPF